MRTILLILLTSVVSLGQEIKGQQFEILGVGKIQVRADHTVLKVSLCSEGNDYNKLAKEINDQVETVRKVLLKIGLSDDQMVISDFMGRDNAIYRDFDNESTNRYVVCRVINAKYIFDKDLNSKIINTLATHELRPEFRFQFGLSDEKKKLVRDELIRLALQDARGKADIIAATYQVKIKRMIKVKYGNTTVDPDLKANSVDLVGETTQPYYTDYKEESPEFDYMETVLVIWEFEE